LGYTSTQWFQEFEWNTVNSHSGSPGFGTNRQVKFRLDVPQVISFGLAWEPSETLLIATDVRHINYSHTAGFKGEGFNPDGSVAGFGWEDIWVFGIGTQYRPMDRLALRLGYNYSENPVPDDLSFFNIPAPAIIQQRISAGAGWDFSDSVQLNIAYYRALENSGEGPMHDPTLGPLAGTSVKNTMHEDSALVEISYRF
ncbi:MAG TPA: outer membrane protein transport protein, partial [Nitrospiria bacterium]|nr:outer membrane protein transport protein [Nitrospiria bacterium]